jgi:asparagine synthase (glutamine-hydrolysing)
MNACLSHRGPDAGGVYYEEDERMNIALGHRRLSIIDLSEAANQPFISASGRYVMVFNGEVYNYREIAQSLGLQNRLRTHSDTEVVLESFAELGASAITKWNGMFALAIWDKQERRLMLIRDRIGKKPLYYYWDEKTLLFASELKAFAGIGLPLTISREAIATYLNIGYIPQPLSVYNEISKLPPGSFLELAEGNIRVERYWNPENAIHTPLVLSDRDAKEQLKELLISSVRYRMASDVPYGAFLSGGVDSSLVVAVAQSLSGIPVKTFSIGFNEQTFNETGYARNVSELLGTEHREIAVSEQAGIELIDTISRVYDEPYADISAVPTMLVSQFAARHVKMVVSGDGGDELFSGYGTYAWAERIANPMVWSGRKWLSLAARTGNKRFRKAATILDVPGKRSLEQHIFSQEQGFFSYADIVKYGNLLHPREVFQPGAGIALSARDRQALFDLEFYLPDDLMVKVDRATMKYGLEARCPILDYRIVEFALSLSPDFKKRNGTVKYLLKQVLYDYLPAGLFDRPKWGFAFPLEKLMKTNLSYLLDRYLSPGTIQKAGFMDGAFVEKLKHNYHSGRTEVYFKLWTLIQLHKWFLENSSHGIR